MATMVGLCVTLPSAGARAAEGGDTWISIPVPKNLQNAGFLAVDRARGDLYYNNFGGGLWRSSDGGKTLIHLGDGTFFPNGVMSGMVLVTPDAAKVVVFNFWESAKPLPANACGYSLDGGKTWESMQNYSNGFTWAAAEPGKGRTLLAFGPALSYSPDLGKTWTRLAISREDIKGMGVFSPKELVVARGDGILFSANAGNTWTNASKAGGCGGPLLTVKDTGYWMSSKGLLVSKDHGKSWTIQGAATSSAPIPGAPIALGKDDNHFFILTQEGLTETRDGGTSWKLVTALPKPAGEYGGGAVDTAFDPLHDMFFLSYHWHAHHGLVGWHWAK
jgi:hypothetical protein